MIAAKERTARKDSEVGLCAPSVLSQPTATPLRELERGCAESQPQPYPHCCGWSATQPSSSLASCDPPSVAARQRILSHSGEPLFLADWQRVLMIHFAVDAAALQRAVPYELDLHDGQAFVSLVAFTMEQMRPRRGGPLTAWLCRPIATHDFLNVRTYVCHRGEPGIHFLAEWLSSWLAAQLGPATFGLPYRFGKIHYAHDPLANAWRGTVRGTEGSFSYHAEPKPGAPLAPAQPGSLTEWLMERYTAFNCVSGRRKYFRIWHPPWPQVAARVTLTDVSLLAANWPWFAGSRLLGANFSPGLRDVWMGRPHRA